MKNFKAIVTGVLALTMVSGMTTGVFADCFDAHIGDSNQCDDNQECGDNFDCGFDQDCDFDYDEDFDFDYDEDFDFDYDEDFDFDYDEDFDFDYDEDFDFDYDEDFDFDFDFDDDQDDDTVIGDSDDFDFGYDDDFGFDFGFNHGHGHNHHKDDDAEIGDSDVEIGDSEDDRDHHHGNRHHHMDFRNDGWFGYLSWDYSFGHMGGFHDKMNEDFGNTILDYMDKFSKDEYIADGSEEWFNPEDGLSVKFSDGEDYYNVKLAPIFENDEVRGGYMYMEYGDDITEGYLLSADDYEDINDSINYEYLKDNVVAQKHSLSNVDELTKYIQDTYQDQDDYYYDVNGDGKVASSDLLNDKKYLLGITEQLGNYDCNNDGRNNTADLLNLKNRLLGK